MIWTRRLRWVLLCVLGASTVLAINASASEYNLKMLPEFGRCKKVGIKKGEFRGRACIRYEPGLGPYTWFSGPGPKPGFTLKTHNVKFKSPGDTITCFSGTGKGTYTGAKTIKVTELLLIECEQSAKAGAEAFCQNEIGSTNGHILFKELEGEVGFISHPKKLRIGLDLKPLSGSALAAFECGGANLLSEKSLGTGIKRELQGSVIGRILPIDKMEMKSTATYEPAKTGGQSFTKFEGRPSDTLTTIVEPKPAEKTPEATVLSAPVEIKNEEALQTLGKCAGAGC
jgi:hypothetical protein